MESVTAVATGAPPSASATSRYGSSPSVQSRTASPSSATAESFSDASSSRVVIFEAKLGAGVCVEINPALVLLKVRADNF